MKKNFRSEGEHMYYYIPIIGHRVAMNKIGIPVDKINIISSKFEDSYAYRGDDMFIIDDESGFWSGPYKISEENKNYYEDNDFKFMGKVEVEDFELDADKYNL